MMNKSTACKRAIACVAIALTFQLTGAASGHANGLSSDLNPHVGSVASDGAAAMLRFRVPTGGGSGERAQSTLALTAGPVWRHDAASPLSPRFNNSSAIEIGVTLSGQPVAKLAGIDVMAAKPAGLNAEGETDGKAARILLGAVLLGAAIWGLTYVWLQNECNNNSCTNGASVTN